MRNWYTYMHVAETEGLSPNEVTAHLLRDCPEVLLNDDPLDKHIIGYLRELASILTPYLSMLPSGSKVLSIGSGWAVLELYLQEKFPHLKIVASDINTNYCRFFNERSKRPIEYRLLNVLEDEKSLKDFDFIYVPGLIYHLDDLSLTKFLRNLQNNVEEKARVCICFRSRDSWMVRLIDNILCPIETKFLDLLKTIVRKQRYKSSKVHHGFRRREKEVLEHLEAVELKVEGSYYSMFATEFNRLWLVLRTRAGELIARLFFNRYPYLNVYVCSKKKDMNTRRNLVLIDPLSGKKIDYSK